MLKKVALAVGLIAVIACTISYENVTVLQAFPFFVFVILALTNVIYKADNTHIIVLLSVIMALINLGIESWIDTGTWVFFGISFMYNESKKQLSA